MALDIASVADADAGEGAGARASAVRAVEIEGMTVDGFVGAGAGADGHESMGSAGGIVAGVGDVVDRTAGADVDVGGEEVKTGVRPSCGEMLAHV